MANLEDYFFTKNTKWILWGLLALLLAALIFHAGVVVGSHNRTMQARGPGVGFDAQLPFGAVHLPQGFMPGGHGAVGTIATVTLPLITLTTRDGMTLHVEVSTSTEIEGAQSSTTQGLVVGETVIVVGDPEDTDNDGAVDARLIRILPMGTPPPLQQ